MKDIQKKRKIFLSLTGFVPHKILSSLFIDTRRKLYEIFDTALLFADISGFTAMSEKIASMGKEGSEEVTKIINGFFEPLIQIIIKWGGDIYRFGGDAIFSFFPSRRGTLPTGLRALCAAKEAIDFVKKHKDTKTKAGTFKINMHVGITKGLVFFKDLKSDFFLGGKVANDLMKTVDKASAGEIVVDTAIKNDSEVAFFKPLQKGIWKYKGMRKMSREISMPSKTIVGGKVPIEVIETKMSSLKAYAPEWLYKRIELKPFFDQRDGEHRKTAVVFLHFSGIPYERDPHKSSIMLTSVYDILMQTIKKYDGWLNKIDIYTDSARVLAVFGFPMAYEDYEQRAILFAHEIVNHPDLEGINLKIGVNSGFVFAVPVGSEIRREYTVMGDAVNLAARLASSSPKNTVLISEAIFNKTFSLFEYQLLGKKKFKGKKARISSYKLLRKRSVDRKVLSKWISESEKLVGRKNEMKKFREIMGLVKKSKGQIFGVTGEAGMGKSRLTQEFIKTLKNVGFQMFGGNCLSYGKVLSYHPWIAILLEFFGILPTDSQAVRKNKIRKVIKTVDKKLLDWLPVIGEVLGVPFAETKLTKFLDAKIRKQKFFDIIFDFIKHTARRKPVCVIIEDLHWADSVSMELINYIGRNIYGKNILFLLIFRPIKEKEEFREKKFYTEIFLKELNKAETAELAGNLLNVSSLPDAFRRLIMGKSQGNPFYVEEIVKSFIEQSFVYEDIKGGWKFSGEIKNIQIPDNVEGVILSRIDRLPIYDKDVLQTASVLGREFDEFIVEGIYHDKKVLKKSLENLKLLDLLRVEKEKGKIKYIFKHILTQEVAYETLSFAKKRELHRNTGTFIEQKLKRRREEFLGLLSHHFYHGMDYDKALLYSVEAGEKAKKVYANEEAIEFFTRAIESYEKLEGEIK